MVDGKPADVVQRSVLQIIINLILNVATSMNGSILAILRSDIRYTFKIAANATNCLLRRGWGPYDDGEPQGFAIRGT